MNRAEGLHVVATLLWQLELATGLKLDAGLAQATVRKSIPHFTKRSVRPSPMAWGFVNLTLAEREGRSRPGFSVEAVNSSAGFQAAYLAPRLKSIRHLLAVALRCKAVTPHPETPTDQTKRC